MLYGITRAEEKANKINKKDVLEAFIKTIEAKKNIIDEFSVDLWILMIQEAIVHQDKTITFKFKKRKISNTLIRKH